MLKKLVIRGQGTSVELPLFAYIRVAKVLNFNKSDIYHKLCDYEEDVEVPSDHYAHYEKAGGWDKSRGYDWTKLTLRRAMYGILPNDVVYRMKAPLQYGSWTYKLTDRLNDITKKGVAKLDDASKVFWNRTDKFGMHVGLYRIYTELNLSPPEITSPQTQYECRGCKGAVDETTQICHTCGIWPTKNGSITNGEGDRND